MTLITHFRSSTSLSDLSIGFVRSAKWVMGQFCLHSSVNLLVHLNRGRAGNLGDERDIQHFGLPWWLKGCNQVRCVLQQVPS